MFSQDSLGRDEFDRLAQLLTRYGNPEQGLNLEALDGFLSALIVTPGMPVMPSEYLPSVWACEPEFESEDDARDALTLILRLNNHIAQRLGRDPDCLDPDDLPLVMVPVDDHGDPVEELPEDFPLGALWALGFLRAVALRADDWQHWWNQHEDIAEGFDAILSLSLLDPAQLRDLDSDGELPTREEREDIVDDLPYILADMNAQRLRDLRPAPARRLDRTGRNDACPCGSGRKYKRCCGDPARLH